MASTAAPSPPSLSPRPTQRPAAMAPASVTRTSSRARLRSGASPRGRVCASDEPGTVELSPLGVMVVDCPRSGSVSWNWDPRGMPDEPQLNASSDAPIAGEPAPAPRAAKPRLLQDGRDMFWSLIPLVLGCIVLAGLVGMCSFQLGRTKGVIPSYDAPAALKADAATLGFPVRLPQLPAGWQDNSGSRGGIAGGRADPSTGQRLNAATSTVGYITPTGMYLSLTQSTADENNLSGSIHSSAYPTGTVDVAGTHWVVYHGAGQNGADAEPVWTTRLTGSPGPPQIRKTGPGSTDQFRTLASATQSQPPLPSR